MKKKNKKQTKKELKTKIPSVCHVGGLLMVGSGLQITWLTFLGKKWQVRFF